MGTNFYWMMPDPDKCASCGRSDPKEEGGHIGKRSAAGRYCWDCRVTLCTGGERAIHSGYSAFADECPKCGAKPVEETWNQGAAGVELGFAKSAQDKPTGVRSCSSFRWATHPDEVRRRCEEAGENEIVEDEYQRRYTGLAFLRMLASNCPVQFHDSIGRTFS